MNRLPHQDGPKGWHRRGYLPHFDGEWTAQFITFNLADAVPKRLLDRWRVELPRQRTDKEFLKLYRRLERALDRGSGECYLRDPKIAQTVERTLQFYHGKKYSLLNWVVMPNHIHMLIVPMLNTSVSTIMRLVKTFSAKEANRILGRSGRFWNEDYFDRYIRNERHHNRVVQYIEMNPVKAKLCERPEDWPYGSARFRTEIEESGELLW
ncbi:MAG: transposase [Aridibacter famidurans]|nr:transposase [Aridibacter famidurans]